MLKTKWVSTKDTEFLRDPCPIEGESGRRIEVGDRIVQCPECKSWYHLDCWEMTGNKCSVLGCNGQGEPAELSQDRGSIHSEQHTIESEVENQTSDWVEDTGRICPPQINYDIEEIDDKLNLIVMGLLEILNDYRANTELTLSDVEFEKIKEFVVEEIYRIPQEYIRASEVALTALLNTLNENKELFQDLFVKIITNKRSILFGDNEVIRQPSSEDTFIPPGWTREDSIEPINQETSWPRWLNRKIFGISILIFVVIGLMFFIIIFVQSL